MRAAALIGPGEIRLVEVPEPGCGPGQVVVHVTGVGLCGSDLAVVSGARRVPSLPWVLGHEGVGVIVAAGRGVTDRRVGQHVAVEPNFCCLRCLPCRAGFTSACPDRIAVGLNAPGLLMERVAVPAGFTFPVADHVGLEDLVCAEPLTVARAAIRRSGIRAGDTCLVVGAGSQGLFLCAALVAMDVHPHVLEPHEGRRQLALGLGAAPADSGDLVDYLFETSGAPNAFGPALERLRPGGTAVLIGMSRAPLDLTSATVVYQQLRIVGSLIYDHPGDFAETVAALEAGTIAPHRVLQAAFPLDDTASAVAATAAAPGKCWIRIGEGSDPPASGADRQRTAEPTRSASISRAVRKMAGT